AVVVLGSSAWPRWTQRHQRKRRRKRQRLGVARPIEAARPALQVKKDQLHGLYRVGEGVVRDRLIRTCRHELLKRRIESELLKLRIESGFDWHPAPVTHVASVARVVMKRRLGIFGLEGCRERPGGELRRKLIGGREQV